MSRPEYRAPPEVFYNNEEAIKYTTSSRMVDIQSTMTTRAMELLLLPEGSSRLILDIGCGSGISGEVLTDAGHQWIGLDISEHMLEVALKRGVQGDMILADAGEALNFRSGVFDGAISISAIQWLCNADKKGHEPYLRLMAFFRWLYNSLNRGARAALQFYPDSPAQIEMITSAAMRSGFGGGLVVDYPNSAKAKKYFLCLWAGTSNLSQKLPTGLQDDSAMDVQHTVGNSMREREHGGRNHKSPSKKKSSKDREWIFNKKDQQRSRGYQVRKDTKYTGRKRKDKF
eukprot:Platyproteum_vivax@DN16578_c0_g1_i1.p1